MGCSVTAKCKCGYESPLLMIGGGMLSSGKECLFPAYCSQGDHLVTVNLLEQPCQCPDKHLTGPVPYTHHSQIGEVGNVEVSSWGFGSERIVLTDGSYFCPACHQLTLRFTKGGLMWD